MKRISILISVMSLWFGAALASGVSSVCQDVQSWVDERRVPAASQFVLHYTWLNQGRNDQSFPVLRGQQIFTVDNCSQNIGGVFEPRGDALVYHVIFDAFQLSPLTPEFGRSNAEQTVIDARDVAMPPEWVLSGHYLP